MIRNNFVALFGSVKMSRKVNAIFLLFLLVLASTGFTIQFHLCQGHVVDFSMFGEAEACMSMENGGNCGAPIQKHGFNKTPCCQNLKYTYAAEDNQKVNQLRWFGANELVVLKPIVQKIFPITEVDIEKRCLNEHPPPPEPQEDLFLLFETFLI